LGHGPKRSRLDEGPSWSNRTVNSRCSEIDLEHNPTLASISGGERSNKEKDPTDLLSPGSEKDPAAAVNTRFATTSHVTEGAQQEDSDRLLSISCSPRRVGRIPLSAVATVRVPPGRLL
jgi:hypothetical protein